MNISVNSNDENIVVSIHEINRAEADKLIPGLIWVANGKGITYTSEFKVGNVQFDLYSYDRGEE